MFTIFLALITLVCFLLIIAVMVQNPKGGGLSSSLGGSQMLGGVQKTTDFLDKSTWFLAATLIILILLSSISFPSMVGQSDSKVIDQTEIAPKTAAPSTPATTAPVTPTEEKK
ncbi:preprotein translocase subunit SecG [Flavobacterium sp. J49]|uniref:preprotein translocase subunit SecG n=1 Tax=Flavobacterium sp. J49 TaxID=2718534 RepID=UPI00159351B1|nr:preprotein translocase subunit SecG [Flavobacterium sp. J49]MBF6640536.1 preprotein translocase subunit SecG [Flavobacterium sp. J49]NIC01783.1 preprotein translocase subunit SecG [Flavobacterium sp. J49]